MKCIGDRRFVRRESVSGDLEAVCAVAWRKPSIKTSVVRLIALAHRDIQHQLCMALDCNECIAVAQVLIVFGSVPFFFLADEGPDFVGFHVTHRNITIFVAISRSHLSPARTKSFRIVSRLTPLIRSTANARILQGHPQGENGLLFETVMDPRSFSLGSVNVFPQSRNGNDAAIAVLTEAGATDIASGAIECDLAFCGFHIDIIHESLAVYQV